MERSAEHPGAARSSRAEALRLFASVFAREVDRPLLEHVIRHRRDLAAALGDDPLAGLDTGAPGACLERLAEEYCRLFIGPRGHMPPVESVATGEGRLWGASTAAVCAFYQSVGLAPAEAARDLPDHIAMELDCLAVLEETGRHAEAAVFAREHPLQWVPTLADHVVRRATLSFYAAWVKGLTQALDDFYGPSKCDKETPDG